MTTHEFMWKEAQREADEAEEAYRLSLMRRRMDDTNAKEDGHAPHHEEV